ncbi:MAG TPA: aldehyde dehydrogenase family protein [Lacipirellulaceae bacterium]|nr:aldehyde dehydrogenase family protein [Lacipirellulaceae bacterium]
MITLPAIRWGEPYESLEVDEVRHFVTGEVVARVNTVGGGIITRDAKKAKRARAALQSLSPAELVDRCKRAGELFESATLPVGDTQQTPEDFVAATSATTGMPLAMVRGNVTKNAFVLKNIDRILDALTRGLDLGILARGYGDEGRGVTVSYQAQTDVLGAVLPSNSPGVHTLWLPVVALQVGLMLKPGSQEPWTPYRVAAALAEAGIPREAVSIYPGAGADIGGAILQAAGRSMIFGGPQTVQQYAGNPRVQVHGPGFSKILLGADVADNWTEYLDLMVDSVYRNGGRSCINCSSIYTPRHGREIAAALAQRLGPIDVLPPEDPQAGLAAFTTPGAAASIYSALERDFADPRTTHATAAYGPRLVEQPSCAYLRPTVWHCQSPECPGANKEYMFPAVAVVDCPQDKMLAEIGPTLVATAITADEQFQR